MKRMILGLGFSACTIVVALACSGKTSDVGGGDGGSSGSSGGGSSSGGSSSGGSSSGGLVKGCPATPPADGSACGVPPLQCEYGADVNPQCNTIATCVASTRGPTAWVVQTARGQCPTPPPGPSCPASYAAVPKGAACTTATSCAYAEGTCTCEIYCGPQYPVSRECDAGTPLSWQCTGAAPGCPAQRPLGGTACAQEQQYCAYGDCRAPAMKCESGAWHVEPQGCAVSTRTKKREIEYLGDEALRQLADRTLSTRLATYRYTSGDPSQHLGFIIEDDPESPAVMSDQGHVDLYAYSSMAVATLQMQAREIDLLRREVEALRRDVDDAKRQAKPAKK